MGTARVSDSLARPILADPSAGDRVLPADTWPVRWARHDGLELGALEAAVSCTRTRTREVLREWGLPPVALEPGAAEEHGRGLLLVGGLRRAASCQPRTAATVPGVRVAAMRVAGARGGPTALSSGDAGRAGGGHAGGGARGGPTALSSGDAGRAGGGGRGHDNPSGLRLAGRGGPGRRQAWGLAGECRR
jgi:hypothetical protein